MNNKILAIAITEYDDEKLNNLSNCKNDLDNILKVLTTKYQFEDVDFIYEKFDTTRKNLFNKLKFYFSHSLEDENIVLLFSGHGQYDKILNTAYWQPSDSDSQDSSTWLNLNDLMTFIKASKAHHISIISDSCFSGAMFQAATRGGGIDALDNKKSRIGFASGSIEPVSDGPEGGLSPFAKVLVEQLENNIKIECPLSVIATNVILSFDKERNQTPTYAPLSNVGHDGGTFILKLKENSYDIPQNITYLKTKYGELFIPIFEKHSEIFKDLRIIREKKSNAVKKQDYLDARKLKDEEDLLKQKIIETFDNLLEDKAQNITIPKEITERIEKYDKEYLLKIKALPKKIEKIKKDLQNLKEKYTQVFIGEEMYELENLENIEKAIIKEEKAERSYISYFLSHKEQFIKNLNKNIIDLYLYFKKIKGNTSSAFMNKKEEDLKKILNNIYDSEINFLLANNIDEIEFLIQIKNNELMILNWIQNKL